MFAALGSPTQAFVDAVKDALEADSTLMGLIVGVFGQLPEASRTEPPYLVLGFRHVDDGQSRSMGVAGGRVSLQIDGWSAKKGASEMHEILSRVRALLERRDLSMLPFCMMGGSLTCEFEDVSHEFDEDAPATSLYHGIQRWTAEIDEAA